MLLIPDCRVSRKTTLDEDLLIRIPHPQAVSLAETILKAGIHQYPQSEFLLIVQTGLRVHLKNEKPVSISSSCNVLECYILLINFPTEECAVRAGCHQYDPTQIYKVITVHDVLYFLLCPVQLCP